MMRDGDVMMEAGKEEWERQAHTPEEQAVLSVGFTDTDYATNFIVFLNPNAWRESCCSPDFQNTSSACWGRNRRCKFEDSQHLFEKTPGGERKPAKQTCWCFSFQFHLQHEIKATWGLMIQVQDKNSYDDRQKIEAEMTQQVYVKIFRTMTTSEDVTRDQLAALEEAIKDGYKKRLQKPLHGGDPAALVQTLPGLISSDQIFEANTAAACFELGIGLKHAVIP